MVDSRGVARTERRRDAPSLNTLGAPLGSVARCGATSCGRPAACAFPTATGSTVRCLLHALGYGPTFQRALGVAAVVGTILLLISQGGSLLAGHVTGLIAATAGLTYLVPLSAPTYSAMAANRL